VGTSHGTDLDRPAARPGLALGLPMLVIVVILAGATALLVGTKAGKPALPGNATAAKATRFEPSEVLHDASTLRSS
jgi:hypothetical protein